MIYRSKVTATSKMELIVTINNRSWELWSTITKSFIFDIVAVQIHLQIFCSSSLKNSIVQLLRRLYPSNLYWWKVPIHTCHFIFDYVITWWMKTIISQLYKSFLYQIWKEKEKNRIKSKLSYLEVVLLIYLWAYDYKFRLMFADVITTISKLK